MRSFFRPTPETFSPLPPGCRFHRIQRPQGQGHYTTESGIFKWFFAQALLKGELAGPKGLTEGFCGRYLRFYEISGEYAQSLGSPVGELAGRKG